MYVVAIAALSDPAADLRQLAADLGTTLYELKLVLNAGFPAVVVLSVDVSVAANAVRAIERHGHRAISADRRTFTPSQAMRAVVDVRFDADELRGDARGEGLPYRDIFALLRGSHRSQETSVREEKERKFRPGMAIATGGLVNSKTTTQKVVTRTETREQVLYLFTRSGPPWILREHGARYAGLGAALSPTSLENFKTTLAGLRQRAPSALYDERLMAARAIRGIADGAAATDLLAHLIVSEARSRSAALDVTNPLA
jgi:hypothetical protein